VSGLKDYKECIRKLEFTELLDILNCEELLEAIKQLAMEDEQDVIPITFVLYALEHIDDKKLKARYYDLASFLFFIVYCTPGGYKLGLEYQMKAAQSDDANIEYKASIIGMYSNLPENILDRKTGREIAYEILEVDPQNERALEYLHCCNERFMSYSPQASGYN
jgi:hypothetical protein